MSAYKAKGTFSATLKPRIGDRSSGRKDFGGMVISKEYSGDLAAKGDGEMLSHRTQVEGSAAYVAIEHVSGRLAGIPGSFVLLHSGLMDQGEQRQRISVVPDSATGKLAGLRGKMTVKIIDDEHHYEFSYSFAE